MILKVLLNAISFNAFAKQSFLCLCLGNEEFILVSKTPRLNSVCYHGCPIRYSEPIPMYIYMYDTNSGSLKDFVYVYLYKSECIAIII
jgi:hypothetical protein